MGRVAEWKSARAGTWAKVSPGFEVVVPLLCIPKTQALLVFFLWPAAFAVQHFPVSLTLRLTGHFGLPYLAALTPAAIALA